jgi:DNA-binding transcriptional LysR family regulator
MRGIRKTFFAPAAASPTIRIPNGAARPMSSPSPRRLVFALGTNQLLSWATAFYVPAVIAEPAAQAIGVTPAAARQVMPGLEIVVATGNTPEILRQVQEGRLDMGLVTLPRALARGLSRIPLCRDAMAALVPARLAVGAAVSPEQLADQPLILYEAGGDTRRVVDAWFAAAGLAPKPIMELGSVEAIKVLVGSGLGASVLPQMALADEIAGARVLALRPATARELGVVMRTEKLLDRGLRVLLAALRQAVGAC